MLIIYSLMDKAKVLETFLEEETQNEEKSKNLQEIWEDN